MTPVAVPKGSTQTIAGLSLATDKDTPLVMVSGSAALSNITQTGAGFLLDMRSATKVIGSHLTANTGSLQAYGIFGGGDGSKNPDWNYFELDHVDIRLGGDPAMYLGWANSDTEMLKLKPTKPGQFVNRSDVCECFIYHGGDPTSKLSWTLAPNYGMHGIRLYLSEGEITNSTIINTNPYRGATLNFRNLRKLLLHNVTTGGCPGSAGMGLGPTLVDPKEMLVSDLHAYQCNLSVGQELTIYNGVVGTDAKGEVDENKPGATFNDCTIRQLSTGRWCLAAVEVPIITNTGPGGTQVKVYGARPASRVKFINCRFVGGRGIMDETSALGREWITIDPTCKWSAN